MLLVKTVVKQSAIAGVGLFADQDIKQGDIVWKYHQDSCSIITQNQFQTLIDSYQKSEKEIIKYYLTYVYYQNCLNGAVLCLDNGRFVNHSDEPSLGAASHLSPEQACLCSVALRDIKKGEELTENYNSFDSSEWLDDLCEKYQVFHFSLEMSAL